MNIYSTHRQELDTRLSIIPSNVCIRNDLRDDRSDSGKAVGDVTSAGKFEGVAKVNKELGAMFRSSERKKFCNL